MACDASLGLVCAPRGLVGPRAFAWMAASFLRGCYGQPDTASHDLDTIPGLLLGSTKPRAEWGALVRVAGARDEDVEGAGRRPVTPGQTAPAPSSGVGSAAGCMRAGPLSLGATS